MLLKKKKLYIYIYIYIYPMRWIFSSPFLPCSWLYLGHIFLDGWEWYHKFYSVSMHVLRVWGFLGFVSPVHCHRDYFLTSYLVTARDVNLTTSLFFVRTTSHSSWKVTFRFDHKISRRPPIKWAWCLWVKNCGTWPKPLSLFLILADGV